VLSGCLMSALVGFAPALPHVLGPGWDDVPAVLLWAGITLTASFPAVVGTYPYLYAVDQGATVVLGAALTALVWLAVMVPLLSPLGAVAAPIGWLAGASVQILVLLRRTTLDSDARMMRSVAPVAALGVVALLAGWSTARLGGRTLVAGFAGAVVAEAILLVALAFTGRSALRDARAFAGLALAALRARRGPKLQVSEV
jgi:hypothetical protein